MAHNLIKNHLNNRKRCVHCNNEYSSFKCYNLGVPKGSNLNPVLSLLYINDIVNSSCDIKFTLYANGTTLSMKNANKNTLDEKMTHEMINVKQWVDCTKN